VVKKNHKKRQVDSTCVFEFNSAVVLLVFDCNVSWRNISLHPRTRSRCSFPTICPVLTLPFDFPGRSFYAKSYKPLSRRWSELWRSPWSAGEKSVVTQAGILKLWYFPEVISASLRFRFSLIGALPEVKVTSISPLHFSSIQRATGRFVNWNITSHKFEVSAFSLVTPAMTFLFTHHFKNQKEAWISRFPLNREALDLSWRILSKNRFNIGNII